MLGQGLPSTASKAVRLDKRESEHPNHPLPTQGNVCHPLFLRGSEMVLKVSSGNCELACSALNNIRPQIRTRSRLACEAFQEATRFFSALGVSCRSPSLFLTSSTLLNREEWSVGVREPGQGRCGSPSSPQYTLNSC